MSSHRKSEGTTTRLLAAADECLKPHSKRHVSIVDSLEREHLAAADAAIDQAVVRDQLKQDVRHEFQRLKSFLEAAEVS